MQSEYPFFFFNDTATTEIYTLSLHDALPIPDPKKCRIPISPQSSTSGKFRWSQVVPVNASSAACSLMVTGNTEGVRKPARPAGHNCRWPPTDRKSNV